MTDRPANLRETHIAAFRRDGGGFLRRPSSHVFPGLLARAAIGERLWVREPFHLSARFDDRAPSYAAAIGERVAAWPADAAPPQGVGRRRFARELPRIFHRAHLIILGRRLVRLHELSDAEILRDGHASRAAFATWWDEQLGAGAHTISGEAARYDDNPRLVELHVEWVGRPL